jgi:Zn finger protein HypA/HybF involved in hydrogenase expression
MTVDTSVFARIIKQEKQKDGTLLVTGIATDDTLDVDQQICDPEWLARAMPEWFKFGNIREQHSNIAAGVATKYEQDGAQHIVTARVVDPSSVMKVEAGVLKGFSIGIRDPRVSKDKAAPGGRIVDGEIVEVSLVDRPANPSCLLELAKSVGGIMQQTETLIEKDAAMERCEDCGKAYKTEELDAEKMCADCAEGMKANHTEESADKEMEASVEMAAEESTETTEEKMMEEPVAMAAEESSQAIGEESSQVMGEESSREGGIAGVAGKEEMSEHVEEEMATLAQLSETVARIEAMLSEYVKSKADDSAEEVAKSVKAIDERLGKVEKSASRGPVRTVTKAVPSVDASAVKAAKAATYRAKAAATTDPALAEGYLLLAGEAEIN